MPLDRHSETVPGAAETGWFPLSERQQTEAIIESAHAAAAAFAAAGWKWGGSWNGKGWDDGRVPSEGEIALRLAELADGLELDHSRRTGRLCVDRHIEDGREVFDVSLQLGSVYGEEPKQP